MPSPIVFFNGFFVPLEQARVSILDRGLAYGDGLFETLRAYKGKLFLPDLHWNRLFQACQAIHLELPVTPFELSRLAQTTLEHNNLEDAIVRLMVTRGESQPGLGFDESQWPTCIIYPRAIASLPRGYYSEGVAVTLVSQGANEIPGLEMRLKSCNYLANILASREAKMNGFFEALLLDSNGNITEGTFSNVFLVHNGILKTPPLNQYILDGVTRRVVLDLARDSGIRVEETPLSRRLPLSADEMFITNTGIELLPVTKVDAQPIGKGRPGETTRFLHREFLKIVEKQLR